jgi:hypothetical protein
MVPNGDFFVTFAPWTVSGIWGIMATSARGFGPADP